RVGSEKSVQVDARILSATNRDLRTEVQGGNFREDLLFRLSVVRLDVPPLRERTEDIPLRAETHLQELMKEGKIRGKRFAADTMNVLARYRWPGNVRELHNAVAHAALMAQQEEIQPEDFPLELAASGEWLQALDRLLPSDATLEHTLRAVERHMIARALKRSG